MFIYGFICAVVASDAPTDQLQHQNTWYMLVMGRQSQLEVQKNLNLF